MQERFQWWCLATMFQLLSHIPHQCLVPQSACRGHHTNSCPDLARLGKTFHQSPPTSGMNDDHPFTHPFLSIIWEVLCPIVVTSLVNILQSSTIWWSLSHKWRKLLGMQSLVAILFCWKHPTPTSGVDFRKLNASDVIFLVLHILGSSSNFV